VLLELRISPNAVHFIEVAAEEEDGGIDAHSCLGGKRRHASCLPSIRVSTRCASRVETEDEGEEDGGGGKKRPAAEGQAPAKETPSLIHTHTHTASRQGATF